jgi:hypothetical protein
MKAYLKKSKERSKFVFGWNSIKKSWFINDEYDVWRVISIDVGAEAMGVKALAIRTYFPMCLKVKLCPKQWVQGMVCPPKGAHFVVTLALGLRLKQRLARLRAKREAQESPHIFSRVQKVWGNEPSHSQVNSHCGNWHPKWTFEFHNAIARAKTHRFEEFFISLENYWNIDVWNGSAWFIWTFETQVMIKRKARTTKGQESTWFPHVQVACDASLKNFQQGLQLRFKPHHNQNFACEV